VSNKLQYQLITFIKVLDVILYSHYTFIVSFRRCPTSSLGLCSKGKMHLFLTFMGPCTAIIFQNISNKLQRYTVYFIWKLLYIFRVVPPPIIRSANSCIYSIWYFSHCNGYS